MKLLENEVKLDFLTESVLLTNHRIIKEYRNSYKISIFLEKISSIEMYYRENPFYMLSGLLFFFFFLVLLPREQTYGIWMENWMGVLLMIVGVIFMIAFFFTKRHVIIVSPDGGEDIRVSIKWATNERIEEFITNVQEAKLRKK
jgi:hypothetical protein